MFVFKKLMLGRVQFVWYEARSSCSYPLCSVYITRMYDPAHVLCVYDRICLKKSGLTMFQIHATPHANDLCVLFPHLLHSACSCTARRLWDSTVCSRAARTTLPTKTVAGEKTGSAGSFEMTNPVARHAIPHSLFYH